MKKFLILILICSVQNIFSQAAANSDKETPPKEAVSNSNNDNLIYNTAAIEVQPEFPGGPMALDSFINKSYNKPTTDKVKGKVYMMFVIEKDGSLSDIKVIRDIGYETGAEAIRVLKTSPKWNPGRLDNKAVRVLYSMPIIVN